MIENYQRTIRFIDQKSIENMLFSVKCWLVSVLNQ